MYYRADERWDCEQLTAKNTSYVPTEENSETLEAWSENYGSPCFETENEGRYFKMSDCGVMCYSQWFAGLSCPREGALPLNPPMWDISLMKQFEVARSKLSRYNFIVISEFLEDPGYVAAVERLFGVPGVARKEYLSWCEAESHAANEMIPLVIKNETMEKLTLSNRFDKFLYDQFSDCLRYRRKKDFQEWDLSRFETNKTIQMDYKRWEQLNPATAAPKPIHKKWLDHPTNQKWRSRFKTTT
jgi:hypothetical protein